MNTMKFTQAQQAAMKSVADNFGLPEVVSNPGTFYDESSGLIISPHLSDNFQTLPQVGVYNRSECTTYENPHDGIAGSMVVKIRSAIEQAFKELPKEKSSAEKKKFKPKEIHDSTKDGQDYTARMPQPPAKEIILNEPKTETKTETKIPETQEVKRDESKTEKAQDVIPSYPKVQEPEPKKTVPVKMCVLDGFALTPKRAEECFNLEEPFTCNEDCAEKFKAKLMQKSKEEVPLKPRRQAKEVEVMPREPKPTTRAMMPTKTVTQKGLMIKNFVPRCAEIGGIRIGQKGTKTTASGYRLPEKLDHFIVTTPNKDKSGNFILDDVMTLLPENPTKLNIMLLYDDETMNFSTQYREIRGGRIVCSGDGEIAFDRQTGEEIKCDIDTCPKYQRKECKLNGILSVILLDKPTIGGVYRYRTTGWNSVQSIMTSMLMIKTMTRGLLAMIPLTLTLTPKMVTPKGADKAHTIYFVNIEYHGTNLLEKVIEVSKHRLAMQSEIMKLENQSLLLAPESEEELKDIQEEFYPEVSK